MVRVVVDDDTQSIIRGHAVGVYFITSGSKDRQDMTTSLKVEVENARPEK